MPAKAAPLSISIAESAMKIINALELDPKAPTPNQMGRLFANLVITRSNGMFDDATWLAFLDHLCFPDHRPLPDVFLVPAASLPSLQGCLSAVEEIYQTCPEVGAQDNTNAAQES